MAFKTIECMLNCIVQKAVTVLRVTVNHDDGSMAIGFVDEIILFLDGGVQSVGVFICSFGLNKFTNDLDGTTDAELNGFPHKVFDHAHLVE